MENGVSYARYSSISQDEQTIEMQLNKCRKFAQEHKINIINEYIDEAKTGRNGRRDGLQQLLIDSKEHKFKYVIMYMSDRYYRNAFEALAFEEELKKNGVKLLFTMEIYDDTPQGKFMKLINYANNQFYSDLYSVKISNGLAENASKSLSIGSNVPLGFKTNKETKQIEVDPITAPIVNEIFERYAKGETVAKIIQDLNNHGYKTKRGNKFNKNSLHRMLKNKKYIGIYEYKGQEMPNKIPRIVSDQLFKKVQQIMEKNKKAPARQRARNEYLLTQKLFCGYCGEMMTGYSAKKKYNYYGCKGKKSHTCNKKPIYKNYLENLVVDETKTFLNNQKNIDMIIKGIKQLNETEYKNDYLLSLKKQLKISIKKKNNLLDALTDCNDKTIRQDIYNKLTELNNTIENINLNLSSLEKPVDPLLFEKVKFIIQKFKNESIDDLKFKKTIINLFIDKIFLYDDKVIILFLTTKRKSINLSQNIEKQTKSLFNTTMVEMRRIELLSERFLNKRLQV